jgi:peptidoglycan/xylan/chitin deacetylase (PgdA/CDA1 family)
MKRRLISLLKTIASKVPLPVYSRLIQRDVVDFFWHAVSDHPMPHVSNLYPVVSLQDFESSILYLKENFTFINYQQLHAHILDGRQLPPKAIHISFDDGYVECFNNVRPLLLQHGIPCTFFLTTDLIDNQILFYRNKQSLGVERLKDPAFDFQSAQFHHLTSKTPSLPSNRTDFISWFKDLRLPDEELIDQICDVLEVDWRIFLSSKKPYLNKNQILQMHAEGFTIGSHTKTHRKLMDLSNDEIHDEILGSCQITREITNQEIVPFSFPHSAWGLDRALLAEIRAQNPIIGLLFDTKGLHQDVNFIHNRIWAERPLSQLSNLDAQATRRHLHLAFQETWVDELSEKGRNLRVSS